MPQAAVTQGVCMFPQTQRTTLERDHGRLFLSSLPSPVYRMPLYSEDGKSSTLAFSEDGRGGTEPVSTIYGRPLCVF